MNGTVRYIHCAPEQGAEALTAVERDYSIDLDPGIHRRNITTEAVSLNHLVDTEFRIGEAVCTGTELCEPC